MSIRALGFVALITLSASACAPQCSPRGTTRCSGSSAQICDADGHWQSFLDCAALDPGWMCAPLGGDHTCLPPDDASSADGGTP